MTVYDIVLRGGTLYDGSGADPIVADLAIEGDRIAAITTSGTLSGNRSFDVAGLAVAAGFINMLSWASEALILDGHSQSDIRQGVTLEVMGEGTSMGPLNDAMKAEREKTLVSSPEYHYDIQWTTLGDYLTFLERRGVATNIASFVGSSTLRIHAMGYVDRPPTAAELATMQALLHQAMQEGAMGLSTALIYPPASYAQTAELIALAQVVAHYDGLYISHIRSEGSAILEALDELITIAQSAQVRAEIYHLKLAGRSNWDKVEAVLARIAAAQATGLAITADMYPYPASGTGLASCLPPWAHEGGHDALMKRLRTADTRARIQADMLQPSAAWENMFYENAPENILLMGFKNPNLRQLAGKTLAEISALRGTSPEDTVLDLILEDDSRIFTIYFSMLEDNLRRQLREPYISFCSDAGSLAPVHPFTATPVHPRAYGSFARVLAKYVRAEGILSLADAIRRMTALPAAVLKLQDRGRLQVGHYADIAVFDPTTIQDHATFANPHQYATGMQHVFVNGTAVLMDGEHTGAMAGRVVRGAGWAGA